jgi:PAS domain S-box-containing protein
MRSSKGKSPVQERVTRSQKTTQQRIASAARPGSKPAEGRFRLAFDNAPIGMAIVGLDYRLKRVNKSLCAALGYSDNELLDRKFTDITHPDDIQRDSGLADELFKGEIPSYRLEKRFVTKDGNVAWLDLTAVMIGEKKAKPLYGLAMVENITERKRVHEALRTSEERYRSFVVNSSEGIWRLEVEQPIDTSLPADDQIKLFRKHAYVAECNDAMARMYGHHRAEDMVGSRFADFAPIASTAGTTSMRSFINNGYRLLEVKAEEVDSNGARKSFSSNIIGVVMNGMLLRVWGVQRDETEAKQAERDLKYSREQLRSLAAYLQAIREKERADISREMHDVLGQALTALKIDISRLRKKVMTNSDGGRAMMPERLENIEGLLNETIASVKSLSTELRPGVLDKLGLAAAIEWQCEEFGRRTGIKSECHIPRKDLFISAEKSTAIFRILQEALANVARHSKATSVRIELSVDKPNVVLTVTDNGRGITEDEILAPQSLGLLGMRERAEVLGGRFTVEGKPGAGSVLKAIAPTDSAAYSARGKSR